MISGRFSQFYIDVGAISKEKKAKLDEIGMSQDLGFGLTRYWFNYNKIDTVEKIMEDRVVIDVKHQKKHIAEAIFHDEGLGKITITMGEEAVKIDDFRYPGPRPQTREAGLVMLADVVEAASRTLENPTPARIQGLVQNLINKIFSDGQLDDCELTLKDLHRIARSFYKILNGIHHHRIEYAEAQSQPQGKGGESKNGDSDRQSPKKAARPSGQRPDESRGHLKRLGLS